MTLTSHSLPFKRLITDTDFSLYEGARILISGGTGLVGGYLAAAIARGCVKQNIRLASPIAVTGNRSNHFLHDLIQAKHIMVKPMSEILTTTENHTFTHTFHAASPASPNNFNEVQTLMFLNHDILPKLVEATSQFFVFFSTGEVYGTDAPPHVTEDYQGKVTSSKERASYPIAKLSGEQLLQQLAKDSEATIRVVRLFHTFGPGISEIDPRSFSAFLYQAVQNKSILLSSQGTQIRTFLHLADTTRALTAIMQTKMLVESEPINLGSSNPISIYDFASLVAKFTESKIVMNWSSDFEQSPNNILIPDTNKLMGLGWKEQIGTADAIQDVLAWLKLSDQEKQF